MEREIFLRKGRTKNDLHRAVVSTDSVFAAQSGTFVGVYNKRGAVIYVRITTTCSVDIYFCQARGFSIDLHAAWRYAVRGVSLALAVEYRHYVLN